MLLTAGGVAAALAPTACGSDTIAAGGTVAEAFKDNVVLDHAGIAVSDPRRPPR